MQDDGRIRYFKNKENIGSRLNHTRCIEEARGEYFKFVNADDVLLAGLFTRQLEVLMADPEVTLVTCDLIVTDASLNRVRTVRYLPGRRTADQVRNVCLSGLGNLIGGPTNFMFRLADAAGIGFDHNYKFVSDLKFGLQLLNRGYYVNTEQLGYLYRRHAGSDTFNNCPEEIRVREFVRLVEEFDWWNAANCLKILHSGDLAGRAAVVQNWKRALGMRQNRNAVRAVADLLKIKAISEGQQ